MSWLFVIVGIAVVVGVALLAVGGPDGLPEPTRDRVPDLTAADLSASDQPASDRSANDLLAGDPVARDLAGTGLAAADPAANELPSAGLADGAPGDTPAVARAVDVDEIRFDIGLRGYRMDEVDEVLDRLGDELSARDARIAALQARLDQATAGPGHEAGPAYAAGPEFEATPVYEATPAYEAGPGSEAQSGGAVRRDEPGQ
ncbi:MAG: DivIVA domain-containing protein [Actinomycetota bacterium]|nr:MAG: DivIVA domain-containing protein [Actinomycetota bacterium]